MNVEPLVIIQSLLRRLHDQNILYCHWKSNEHLAASMVGDTDLDLLFEDARRADIERILAESGFRYFPTVRHAHYPGVLDYLGMDPHTTKIVHIHAHFRLTVGEKYLKGYHLPWEHLLLNTRLFDSEYRIYTADPNLETILLLTREALKHRTRDSFQMLSGRKWLGENIERELKWLLQRLDVGTLEGTLRKLGADEKVVALYHRVLGSEQGHTDVLEFVRSIKKFCRPYRDYPPVRAWLMRLFREARIRGLQRLKRARPNFPPAIPIKRVRSSGGVVIAFVGSDGSGKSTARTSTSKWLGEKLDVLSLYLGSGQGPRSFTRKALAGIRDMRDRKPGRKTPSPPSDGAAARAVKGQALLSKLFRIAWALVLASERRRKVRTAWTARGRGMIVITDRFPQDQVFGFNDGPLLAEFRNHSNALVRWVAGWEWRQYKAISALHPPDVVVRLRVSPTIATLRRPEMSDEETRRKQGALFGVDWQATAVFTIDADQDLESVTKEIRTRIWSVLR